MLNIGEIGDIIEYCFFKVFYNFIKTIDQNLKYEYMMDCINKIFFNYFIVFIIYCSIIKYYSYIWSFSFYIYSTKNFTINSIIVLIYLKRINNKSEFIPYNNFYHNILFFSHKKFLIVNLIYFLFLC